MSERGEAPAAAASAGAGGEMPAKKQKLSSDENSNPGDLSGDENVRAGGGEAGGAGAGWGGAVRRERGASRRGRAGGNAEVKRGGRLPDRPRSGVRGFEPARAHPGRDGGEEGEEGVSPPASGR